MHDDAITGIIFTIACGCVLPIYYIWQSTRRKISESKDRTQIVLAAIEKNKETDVEELLRKMAPKQKLLKEKLLTKLLWGGIIAFLGTTLIVFCIVQGIIGGMPTEVLQIFSLIGAVLLGVGIAFLVNYYVGKKMLAKEMEAEQAKLLEQA